jgi:hypothetical protein
VIGCPSPTVETRKEGSSMPRRGDRAARLWRLALSVCRRYAPRTPAVALGVIVGLMGAVTVLRICTEAIFRSLNRPVELSRVTFVVGLRSWTKSRKLQFRVDFSPMELLASERSTSERLVSVVVVW